MSELKLASAGHDIRLWDCNGFSLVKQFNPHSSNICSLCWGADNSTLVSASTAGDKIVLTYVNQAFYTHEFAVGEGRTCVALNSSSRYVLMGGQNGHIGIWDLKTKQLRKTYTEHKGAITCLSFNHNDTDIASAAENGNIILYNVVTGQGSSPLCTAKASPVRQLKYNHIRHYTLGSVSDDGCVNMWDTNKRCLIHSFSDQHKAPATGLSFSPLNDMLLVSVGLDKRMICYDCRSCQPVKTIIAESPLTSIDMAADGGTVAVGTTRGKIYIYDFRRTAEPINMIAAHKSSVQCLAFQYNHKAIRQVVGGNSNKVSTVATKKSSSKPGSSQRGNDTYIKPVADINANQTTLAANSYEETQNPGEPLMPSSNRDSSGFNEIYSPLRETNQRASYGEGDKSLQNKSDNSSNHSADTDTIYSPLRKDDSSAQKAAVSRPWTYSASRVAGQGEPPARSQAEQPAVSVRLPSPEGAESSPESRSLGSSQDDQDFYVTAPAAPFSRQASDPAKHDRRLPSPHASPAAQESTTSKSHQLADTPHVAVQPISNTPRQSVTRQTSDPLGITDPHSITRQTSDPNSITRHLSEAWENGAASQVGGNVTHFQMEVMRNLVAEAMEDVREELRRDILNMHMEMIKMFQLQQMEMREALQQYSVNGELLAEIERLREENKRLKQTF